MNTILRAPIDDYLAGLARLLPGATWRRGAIVLAALAVSWWVYVPLHELAHAFGCVAAGGEVWRLEIDAVYGAALLQHLFPFVAVGSEYAGQLVGFDTRGSDLVYLATDFAPFLLTIALGVPLLRAVPHIAADNGAAVAFASAVPIAYAPMISLPGDYYEMGSIVVSRLAASLTGNPVERWRGDDVFLVVERLGAANAAASDWLTVGAAMALGAVLALATYAAGAAWSSLLGGLWRGVSARGTSA